MRKPRKIPEKIFFSVIYLVFFLAGALLALEAFYYFDSSDTSSGEKVESNPGNGIEQNVVLEEIIMEGTPFQSRIYANWSQEPGPAVLVIGGIHGDEPSGYHAAGEIKQWEVERGTLLVMPYANPPAIEEEERYAEGKRDLNRAFRDVDESDLTGKAAASINDFIRRYQPDLILDLHSAPDFRRVDPGSLGQTLIFCGAEDTEEVVYGVKEEVNRRIDKKKHRYLVVDPPSRGTLVRESYRRFGISGIIVEASRELSLYEKTSYHMKVVSKILEILEMKNL